MEDSKCALIDIGANIGIVSLQAMNMSKTTNEVFLIEPVPNHVTAMTYNLRELMKISKIHIFNFALTLNAGIETIYVQNSNHGNTSLFNSVMPQDEIIEIQIQTASTAEFFKRHFNRFETLVIKCDIQGFDAKVLSLIPENVWQKINYLVIEVWALPEIEIKDVEKLMNYLENFSTAVWSDDQKLQLSTKDISEFWLSKSGKHKNLFLGRGN
jgi:FkbM family methyltransferase